MTVRGRLRPVRACHTPPLRWRRPLGGRRPAPRHPSREERPVIATIPSATLLGVDGRRVAVEVHVSAGLPCFTVVGLPDTACRESRDRVRAALLSSGLSWPLRRVTVNLAPSAIRKNGA